MPIGDFNAEESESCFSQFPFEMNAKSIFRGATCYNSLSNPSCIDIVITNSSLSLQNTKATSACLSDFDKIVMPVSKQIFQRSSPR